jgi:hypothetical protein
MRDRQRRARKRKGVAASRKRTGTREHEEERKTRKRLLVGQSRLRGWSPLSLAAVAAGLRRLPRRVLAGADGYMFQCERQRQQQQRRQGRRELRARWRDDERTVEQFEIRGP